MTNLNNGSRETINMSFMRAIICLLLPPLAVIDKGIGSILLVTVLWICGWIPGVIAAIIIGQR
jgi:uncharacterized membrane protein YqaE (UPF0057 family)